MIEKKDGEEPDIDALLFFFTEAINEGIEIENDSSDTPHNLIDEKKTGRIITAFGYQNAGEKLKSIIVDASTVESNNKNEKN